MTVLQYLSPHLEEFPEHGEKNPEESELPLVGGQHLHR